MNPGAGGNAAIPKAEAAAGPSLSADVGSVAASDAQETATRTQASQSDGTASPDTGEAATDGDITMLRTQVAKLGWSKPKARSWLKATFGESETKALTQQQAANAFALLLAAAQDDTDTAYGVVYDRLKAEGRVL